ncbi:helix-turn-helix domain-containing protein [Plantibacter sp. 2H11-2]|uniref:helix-turn-helix domain-containing protein n=1 Tax=Plantibacter sp. 2H11-2 TaxID=3414431 RepID=UPI003CF89CDF
MTVEDERTLASAYEAGHSIAELEKQFKLSHGAVLRALHRVGVEMRAKAPRVTTR